MGFRSNQRQNLVEIAYQAGFSATSEFQEVDQNAPVAKNALLRHEIPADIGLLVQYLQSHGQPFFFKFAQQNENYVNLYYVAIFITKLWT